MRDWTGQYFLATSNNLCQITCVDEDRQLLGVNYDHKPDGDYYRFSIPYFTFTNMVDAGTYKLQTEEEAFIRLPHLKSENTKSTEKEVIEI